MSSEHFFVEPEPLADALPQWYALLRAYYRQDPLARLA
ncbi:Phosphoenolpyruvate:glucose-phosphotransferase regulator [Bordetella pertussis]|nr:Phosphoenolpyruvate:glucose-phosphotransferase regulator [Bordetella pertussis]